MGRFTARFHNAGMLHKDYNNGNLLLGINEQGQAHVELVDLNRIRFHRVGAEEGCRNFVERIAASPRQWSVMVKNYTKERGIDTQQCLDWMADTQKKTPKR